MTEAELIVFREVVMCLQEAVAKLETLAPELRVGGAGNAIELAHEILAEHGDTPNDEIAAAEAAHIGSRLRPEETERDLIPTKPI